MNQREILTIIVFLFFISSVASTIFMTWKVDNVIEAKVVGNMSITINQECGNNVCGADENCPADASYCTDNTCYEPTCTNGCGQTAVASGSTDEACTGSTGCSGGDCQCDGSGNCRSGAAPQPSQGGAGAGGPSGGGGSSISPGELILYTENIKAVAKLDEIIKKRITLKNDGEKSRIINVQIEGIDDKVEIIDSFIIQAGEIKTITIDLSSSELGVFTGKIVLLSDDQRLEIPVIFEVESLQVLFDLTLDVKPKFLLPGEEVTASITLFNINSIGLVNVDIDYFIKDLNNNIILQDKEVISIDTQATFSKSFILPDLEDGEYVFIVQASYQGSVGTTSESFQVGRIESPSPSTSSILALVIMAIIIFAVIIYEFHRKIKHLPIKDSKKIKLNKEKIIKETIEKEKLKKQQIALEEAHSQKLISEKAYQISKDKLNDAIRRFK